MRRTRPESRISAAQRVRPGVPARTLPARDDLAGLGLSAVRPATPRDDSADASGVSAARPISPAQPASAARPVSPARPAAPARPVPGTSSARPVARPAAGSPPAGPPAAGPSDWIEDVLDDAPLDAQHLGVAELGTSGANDRPDAAAPLEPTEAARSSGAAEGTPDETDADEADATDLDTDEADATGADESDAVWTFDRDAAEQAAAWRAARPAYVRPEQVLWSDADTAPALLAASLAARLGGSVAVVRLDGDDYLVELLAGPAAAADPAPIPAPGHPLHRVPQDGVLSLLGSGAALAYHADPEAAVGQVLVRSLAAPPARARPARRRRPAGRARHRRRRRPRSWTATPTSSPI